jgi:formylglycine-generating enzyme required for sulfatase activity
MKKIIRLIGILIFCGLYTARGQQPVIQGKLKELFAGPAAPGDRDAWLTTMKKWRMEEKDKLHFSDAEYLRPQFSWLKKTFIYVQMMAHDRYFYDPVSGKYTVDRYLSDLKKQYGGIDAVLIWPTYPNIGIDNRNQYDLLHDMPGGIKAVKQMVADFHKHGVKVFFPIMIWDHGTRKLPFSMPAVLIKEMKEIGADGMNGDTMWGVTEDFQHAYDSLDYPVVLQPEVAIKDLKMVEWNTSSWGYYWNYTFVPGISICKWLEPRHQVFVTNRWAVDKTDDLQYAFFNGVGYNAWENIWGIWNQIPDRYEEEIRRIAAIYREFPGIWNSPDWTPFVPVLQQGVFASRFPGDDETVYTFINRDSTDKQGREIQLSYQAGMSYYDIWNGIKLNPQKESDHIILSFPIEANGFGAVLAVRSHGTDPAFDQFLKTMHDRAKKPLKSFSTAWNPLPQQIIPIKKTAPAAKAPEGMMLVPAVKNYTFESKGVMIEGDPLPDAVGTQYPWEQHPARVTKHIMNIPAFYIDKYSVTNEQFKKFLDATHYHPKDDHNFLKDWKNGTYPRGWANKPVTWVSLEDARAYAAWAGKRLPHEWEWQYAAQGHDGRLYPWGNNMDSTRMPPPDQSRSMRPPTDVDAFPQGVSPFGVVDMVGNVWQWTDEYTDEHTRAAVLKGGGYYRATTSHWYFPRAYELNKYGKYLLMAPSLDRSASIGFRCVKDK